MAKSDAPGRKHPWIAFLVVLAIHIPVARWTWRDLAKRTDTEVRGSKKFWQVASAMNTLGSVGYMVYGRKPARVHGLGQTDIHSEFARS